MEIRNVTITNYAKSNRLQQFFISLTDDNISARYVLHI